MLTQMPPYSINFSNQKIETFLAFHETYLPGSLFLGTDSGRLAAQSSPNGKDARTFG